MHTFFFLSFFDVIVSTIIFWLYDSHPQPHPHAHNQGGLFFTASLSSDPIFSFVIIVIIVITIITNIIIIINNIFILIICSPKSELNALDGCLGDHSPVSIVLQLSLIKLLCEPFFYLLL